MGFRSDFVLLRTSFWLVPFIFGCVIGCGVLNEMSLSTGCITGGCKVVSHFYRYLLFLFRPVLPREWYRNVISVVGRSPHCPCVHVPVRISGQFLLRSNPYDHRVYARSVSRSPSP